MQQRGLSPSLSDRLTAPPHRPSQGEGLCPSLQVAELLFLCDLQVGKLRL